MVWIFLNDLSVLRKNGLANVGRVYRAHAVSLHFMYYNFGRNHQTLGTSPAVEAGIADHIWSLEEIAGLLDRSSKL